jgi:hypothetical protein
MTNLLSNSDTVNKPFHAAAVYARLLGMTPERPEKAC